MTARSAFASESINIVGSRIMQDKSPAKTARIVLAGRPTENRQARNHSRQSPQSGSVESDSPACEASAAARDLAPQISAIAFNGHVLGSRDGKYLAAFLAACFASLRFDRQAILRPTVLTGTLNRVAHASPLGGNRWQNRAKSPRDQPPGRRKRS